MGKNIDKVVSKTLKQQIKLQMLIKLQNSVGRYHKINQKQLNVKQKMQGLIKKCLEERIYFQKKERILLMI